MVRESKCHRLFRQECMPHHKLAVNAENRVDHFLIFMESRLKGLKIEHRVFNAPDPGVRGKTCVIKKGGALEKRVIRVFI